MLANHPLIQKVVKGAYNTRPPAPRYVVIWDTDTLLHYLDSLDNTLINFKLLSYKVPVLLTILSGQRVSTLHKFRLSQLQLTTDMAVFNLGTSLLKHSKPGRATAPIVFHRYPHGRRLCPLEAVQDYVQQRNLLAPQVDEFFITRRKPYHPAYKDTLARWVKEVLTSSGIDTSQYAAHSCRSASSSKAKVSGVPMEQILKCGQWKTSHTFVKFYNKNIVRDSQEATRQFAHSILAPAATVCTLPMKFPFFSGNGVPSRMRENICVYLFILYICLYLK